MRHQRGFDFKGRHVDTAYLQHIVAATAIGVVAVCVAAVFVAATRPLTCKGVLGFFAVVPVHDGGRGALNLQLAQLTHRAGASLVIDQAQGVARHHFTGGPIANTARAVG